MKLGVYVYMCMCVCVLVGVSGVHLCTFVQSAFVCRCGIFYVYLSAWIIACQYV